MVDIDYTMLLRNSNEVWDISNSVTQVRYKCFHIGRCGVLTFNIIQKNVSSNPAFNIENGNKITFEYKGKKIFCGYVFKIEYDFDGTYNVTCYDQLIYLMYNYSSVFVNKTASEIITSIANEFQLTIGDIEDTKFAIPRYAPKDKKLFDIIYDALRITGDNSGSSFCLYDDYGKLTLKEVNKMKTDLTISPAVNLTNFKFTKDITNAYTKFIVASNYNDDASTTDELYTANQWQDDELIKKWGILQYFEVAKEGLTQEQIKQKIETLSKIHAQEKQSIIIDAAGEFVRAGEIISVEIKKYDIKQYFLIEEASHTWNGGMDYNMTLTLKGGVID